MDLASEPQTDSLLMTTYKRKLIEVTLPLEAINRESAREKSVRRGHPSTIHLWWARRPLAACRAVLFASLVDDPSAHPDRFPTEAAQETERKRLFAIIEELVKWDNSNDARVLDAAKAEIAASSDGVPPSVLDPFCGGGSIPLEAQRLGLVAHASDINPVAVLITKALIEIPPKFTGLPPVNPGAEAPALGGWSGVSGLAADVRYYGRWMSDQAEVELARNYPLAPTPKGQVPRTVIAWIWARTCLCPNPVCSARMPLVNSFVMRNTPSGRTWMEPIVDRISKQVAYRPRKGGQPISGTVTRDGARCIVCGEPVPLSYIRVEGKAGRMGTQLLSIVVDGQRGREYLAPTTEHERAAEVEPPADPPRAALPHNPRAVTTPNYGIVNHTQLFTNRQLCVLVACSDLVAAAHRKAIADGADTSRADAIATYLGLAIGRLANRCSSQSFWNPNRETVEQVFSRNALPMIWVYAEANPFSDSSGNFIGQIDYLAAALARVPAGVAGYAQQLDATTPLPGPPAMVCTDPPYYDNVPYADLSDFFYVWLRRCVSAYVPELFSTILVPKERELIAEPARQGSKEAAAAFFETGLKTAFGNLVARQLQAYPMTIFYAFKQAEDDGDGDRASTGWETMLQALLDSNCVITGTWPVRTERTGGLREVGRNALASSIVLVCRKRPLDAPLATRKDFLSDLHAELPSALRRLQQGNIAPVDLAQAAIGPGMAVFSRYAKVIEADGSTMAVRAALGIINHVLDETLAEQDGDFDARTRWAVAWFEQFGMNPGEFGVAETLSKAKATAVNALVDAGIVDARAGRVKLVGRDSFSSDWDPATTDWLSVWEVTQRLVWAVENGGDTAAARLVQRVGGLAETARELAYRLYHVCERKRWAKEALSYNGLVVAWPSITRIAAEASGQAVQMTLGS
jgi:putative DNA methylase